MLSDLLYSEQIFQKALGRYTITFCGLNQCVFHSAFSRNGVHCHDCFEICFVTEGAGYFLKEGCRIPIEKNCIFLGVPFVDHEILLEGSTPLRISYFTFQVSKSQNGKPLTREDAIVESFLSTQMDICRNQAHIGAYVDMLQAYHTCGGSYAGETLMLTMLLDMLGSLSSHSSSDPEDVRLIRQAIDSYIYTHLDCRITVADLSKAADLSQRSLFYFFKRHFDTTPNNYVLQVKLSNSVGFLKMGIPEKEIARRFGFSDTAEFCRCFKRLRGVAPRQALSALQIPAPESTPK